MMVTVMIVVVVVVGEVMTGVEGWRDLCHGTVGSILLCKNEGIILGNIIQWYVILKNWMYKIKRYKINWS